MENNVINYASGFYKDKTMPEETLYSLNGELRIITVREGDTPYTSPSREVSEDEAREWAREFINDKDAKFTMTSAGKERFPDIAKEAKANEKENLVDR